MNNYLCLNMSKRGKILVAMSGGLDSTMAALMLHDEGYEVVGVTMKTFDYAQSGGSKKETGCCNLDTINDARAVAVKNGFAHYILDIKDEFGLMVINDFVDEYLAGRTPNPCVLCNTHIKWDALLKKADALGCEFIATGHYAIKGEHNNRHYIQMSVDDTKDQSYVLWGLSQESIRRTIFPLGEMRKTEVRQNALTAGYEAVANKSESYEICFVPDNDYRGFLKRQQPELESKVKGGNYLSTDGKVIGTHEGYPFYTIGQRKGLGIATGEPMFVTQINPENNTVVLGNLNELNRTEMFVHKMNWQLYNTPQTLENVLVKIRYKDKGHQASLMLNGDKVLVKFNETVAGIAPGQSAVFYEDGKVIGGGRIHSSW
jgi:tRNA-uridine 2-sulfurtransferase